MAWNSYIWVKPHFNTPHIKQRCWNEGCTKGLTLSSRRGPVPQGSECAGQTDSCWASLILHATDTGFHTTLSCVGSCRLHPDHSNLGSILHHWSPLQGDSRLQESVENVVGFTYILCTAQCHWPSGKWTGSMCQPYFCKQRQVQLANDTEEFYKELHFKHI